MATPTTSGSSLGPALFIGLSLYILVAGPSDENGPNPSRTMDMRSAQRIFAGPDGPTPVPIVGRIAPPLLGVNRAADLAAPPADQPEVSVPVQPVPVPVVLPQQSAGQLSRPADQGPASEPPPAELVVPGPLGIEASLAAPALREPRPTPTYAGLPPVVLITAPAALRAATQSPPHGQAFSQPWPVPSQLIPAPPEQSTSTDPVLVLQEATMLVVTGDAVFLRQGPSSLTPDVGQFDSGAEATLWETRGLWSRVTIEADPPVTGWMFTEFLGPASEE